MYSVWLHCLQEETVWVTVCHYYPLLWGQRGRHLRLAQAGLMLAVPCFTLPSTGSTVMCDPAPHSSIFKLRNLTVTRKIIEFVQGPTAGVRPEHSSAQLWTLSWLQDPATWSKSGTESSHAYSLCSFTQLLSYALMPCFSMNRWPWHYLGTHRTQRANMMGVLRFWKCQ